MTQGGYLIYEGVRWVLQQATPESASEKSFKLIPFPVSNSVVYHFHPVAFVEQMKLLFSCCKADWSFDKIKAIAYLSSDNNINKHLSGINKAFQDNEINTCLRRIHFLAQVLLESGGLQYTREIGASNEDYGGYPGRGLIQLTGHDNYAAYQEYSGEDVTSNLECKKKLEQNPHAANSAGWFWYSRKLNELADKNDFILITAKINGGFNGYNKRLNYLKKGLKLQCPTLKDISSEYNLTESGAYDIAIYSFAWGLWHDPGLNKTGCSKSKDLSLNGYDRFITLTDDNSSLKNRYGINKMAVFANLKDSKGNVKVRAAAQARINALS